MRAVLALMIFAFGCPETEDAECDVRPNQLVCVDACIFNVDHADCVTVVDACRAEPERDRCDVLLQRCEDMPTAAGCGAAVDAGAD